MVCRGQLINKIFVGGLSLFILFSCNPENNSNTTENNSENKIKEKPYTAIAPDFKSDSAYNWIEKQVAFGPRTPNSKAQKKCADLIVKSGAIAV